MAETLPSTALPRPVTEARPQGSDGRGACGAQAAAKACWGGPPSGSTVCPEACWLGWEAV